MHIISALTKGENFMEIESGPCRLPYENVRSNAYWTRVHFDTQLWPDIDGAAHYRKHLQDCIDNPTIGLLARKKYITGPRMNYPDFAWRNRKIMENDKGIEAAVKYLKGVVNTLYPKTKHIREYMIDKNRVALDEIRPCKGYNRLDKLMIALKKLHIK
jgi:hypothetical protein